MLTQQELKKVLRYDPETGVFIWLIDHGRWNRIKAGTVAGSGGRKSLVHINDKKYLVSRLAVLYMTGCWPLPTVDHKDCNQKNNRWDNLRQATQQEQQRNRKGYSTCGYKGVYANRRGFAAYITIDKKTVYLGKRATPEEAHQLYSEAVKEQYGEFGRINS